MVRRYNAVPGRLDRCRRRRFAGLLCGVDFGWRDPELGRSREEPGGGSDHHVPGPVVQTAADPAHQRFPVASPSRRSHTAAATTPALHHAQTPTPAEGERCPPAQTTAAAAAWRPSLCLARNPTASSAAGQWRGDEEEARRQRGGGVAGHEWWVLAAGSARTAMAPWLVETAGTAVVILTAASAAAGCFGPGGSRGNLARERRGPRRRCRCRCRCRRRERWGGRGSQSTQRRRRAAARWREGA